MPEATPESVTLSSFFEAQVPGQVAGSPDQYVDVPSRYFKQLGEYFTSQASPKDKISMIVTANSRAAGVNSAGNRLWSRIWAMGYARWLWSIGIGASFLPVDKIRVQHYASGMTLTPWTFGTVDNVRTTAGYLDLSHFGFGSYTSTSEGSGGGLVMEGSGNAFTHFFEDMTAANLPSGMAQVFGAGAEHGDYLPLTGDSLYRHSATADNRIAYLRAPNLGTWRWEHVTDASSSAVEGTFTPGDPNDSSVDSSTPVVVQTTMTASDTYVGDTLTFDATHVDFPDVQVGMGFTVFRAGAFVAVGVIDSKTSNSFHSKWTLENPPQTGDVISFGEVGIGVAQYEAPATADRFRGVRVTSLTGITHIFGMGSVRNDGTKGVAIGSHGWSGNGYGNQMDEWPRPEWFKELCVAMDIDLCVAHIATQGSSEADWFTFLDLLADAGIETYAAGDGQHGINGNTESSQYTTAALAQSDHAAGAAQESAFLGDHWSLWEQGGMDNSPHASVVGHSLVARVHLNIANALTRKASGGYTLSSAAPSVGSRQAANVAVGRNP